MITENDKRSDVYLMDALNGSLNIFTSFIHIDPQQLSNEVFLLEPLQALLELETETLGWKFINSRTIFVDNI